MKTLKYFMTSYLLTLIVSYSALAQGPGEPFHPMTAPGARGIRLTGHTLIWENPTSILYNEIYFSEDSTLVSSLDPSVRILSGYPNTVYISVNLNLIGALNIATKYFWRVVEFDSSNYTEGEIWYFKTKGYYPYLEEDFSNGLGNWSIIGPQGINNWIISNSSNAGGSSPELRFTWNPQFNGNSFIVCDYVYDTEPAFFIEFRHFVDMYSDTVTVGCGYTIDEGSTWIPLWEISPTGNVGPANIFLSLPTENNVQFAFYFSGNSNNINYWYIDDVHIYGPITQSFPPSFLQAKTDTLQSKVNLNWNNGSSPDPITGYRIQRKRGLPNDSTNYFVLAETDGITYAYSDTSIQANSVYTYRIQTLSGPGPYGSIWGNEATAYTSDIITASQEENNTITEFILYQNYPNPFNPTTKIKYEIPKLSYVALNVYDILGNEVATIVDEKKPAGSYEVEFSVGQISILSLSSGIYIYKLQAGIFIETKKMVYLK
jgi:hypothetical protein